jgi:hypothetical protein
MKGAMKKTISRFLVLISLTCLGVSAPCLAEQIQTQPANVAARKWLALVDSGKYEESWNAAAAPFREQVTMADWIKSLTTARDVLGKLHKRTLKSNHFATVVPNAPVGKYVVIQFKCVFDSRKDVIETVTPMLDKDGHWRVSGYYLTFQK